MRVYPKSVTKIIQLFDDKPTAEFPMSRDNTLYHLSIDYAFCTSRRMYNSKALSNSKRHTVYLLDMQKWKCIFQHCE